MNAEQVYFIDKKDKVLYTDKNFDGFAKENQSEAYAKNVEGKSIWKLISNQKVQELYKQLFSAVRKSGKNLSINFRCDNDKVIRHMRMSIEPQNKDIIKIGTSLVKEFPRKRILSSQILYMGIKHATPMCSSCNKIFIRKHEKWMEIEKALNLQLVPDPLNVKFDLCGECVHYLEKKIEDALQH